MDPTLLKLARKMIRQKERLERYRTEFVRRVEDRIIERYVEADVFVFRCENGTCFKCPRSSERMIQNKDGCWYLCHRCAEAQIDKDLSKDVSRERSPFSKKREVSK